MKNLCFALGSAYIAFLAFIIVCVDQLLKSCMPIGAETGFTYISFVAWAVYFFAGTGKAGFRAWIGYFVGVGFSILIILLATSLASTGFFAVPIAVLIVVFFVLYLEKVKWIDYIPAMFVASGCFFGIMNYVPEATFCKAATVELIYGSIGLLFGWIAITGKGLIDKACKV